MAVLNSIIKKAAKTSNNNRTFKWLHRKVRTAHTYCQTSTLIQLYPTYSYTTSFVMCDFRSRLAQSACFTPYSRAHIKFAKSRFSSFHIYLYHENTFQLLCVCVSMLLTLIINDNKRSHYEYIRSKANACLNDHPLRI